MPFHANRTASRVLLIAGGLLLGWALLTGCGQTTDGERRTFTVQGPELRVDSGNSDLEIVPDASLDGEIDVVRWFEARTVVGHAEISWEMKEGDVLELHTTCRGITPKCEARHELRIPTGLDVVVDNRNGRVEAADLQGSLDLTSRNGEIEVASHDGPLALETRNGTVRATAITSPEVSATSRNGAVHLELSDAPEVVATDSRNGSTTLVVPDGETYRVRTDTSNGRVTVGVPEDDSSPYRVETRSRNGDITVRTPQ